MLIEKSNKLFAVIFSVFILLLTVVAIFYFVENKNANEDDNIVVKCTDDEYSIVSGEGSIFIPNNSESLMKMVDKIKNLDNYEASTNCMYIITMNSLSNDSIQKLESNYKILSYNLSISNYSYPIEGKALSLEELQTAINNRKEISERNTLENGIINNPAINGYQE